MIAVRTSSRFTPPVERSITVSAPYFTASCSFATSSSRSEALGEAPMLAFTLHLEAMPIAIGSRLGWLMLAGMIMRPRATSSITSDSGRFSRLATIGHLLGDHTLAGVMHLRNVGVAATLLNPGAAHDRLLSGGAGHEWAHLRLRDTAATEGHG